MKNFLIACLAMLTIGACKRGHTTADMAKDICACVMPVVEDGERTTEVLRRGIESEIAALEEQMQKVHDETTRCFQNLEAKYGNMEAYQNEVIEDMRTRCPKAAALLEGAGGG